MSEPIGAMINISTKIAQYFGFIEGIDSKVTKLLHQAFLSAKNNLECARVSSGQNQIDYIKQAQSEFIRAVAVEENENKISSLLGLSMCQAILGDYTNAQITFDKIENVELSKAEKVKAGVVDVSPIGSFFRMIVHGHPTMSLYECRKQQFANAKDQALSLKTKLL